MNGIEATNEPDNDPVDAVPQSGKQASSFRPWVTWLAVFLCVAVFLGLSAEPKRDSWETLSKWGVRPANEIWSGHFAPLVSSAFVHLELWHLAFNVYWLWLLGSRLEQAIGPAWYLLFFLVAAVVSSTAELAVADTTGIGASGVVYAIFGFMWVARHRFPAFFAVLSQRTITLFVVWLFGCIAATMLKIWEVGNAAHVAGLLFGASAAGCLVARYRRRLLFAGLAGAVALSLLPLFWCPWSATWLSSRAYNAHESGNLPLAVDYYDRLILKDSKNAWAYYNRGLAYQSLHDDRQAHADFKRAEELDPSYSATDRE